MEYGTLYFRLEDILASRNISKNKICKELDIPRTNLNRYCRNDFQRIDAALLCKLCWYLDVEVGELIVYRQTTEGQKD